MTHQKYAACLLIVVFSFAGLFAARSADAPEAANAEKPPQKMKVTLNDITFDSDFDNGSLGGVKALGPDKFEIDLYTEEGEKWAARLWYRFFATASLSADDRSITLHFDGSRASRPVVRYWDSGWRHATHEECPGSNTLILNFDANSPMAEVAMYFPLGLRETRDEVKKIVEASPHAVIETMGFSGQNREMHLVTVTDASVPDDGPTTESRKHRVWVHSRAHPGEVTSTHVLLGFLEQVAEDSPVGARLRRHCIFNVMPLLNVDGVYLGMSRWNPNGKDLEDRWCEFEEPETQAMKKYIDAFMTGPNPIEVSLNLHSTQTRRAGDTFFYKHDYPSVSRRFEEIQQRFIDCFDRATPLFDNLTPRSSQLHECRFLESYYWNNWGESVMAMTHEGNFRTRITDGELITNADYRELGRAMARAMIEYFNLPEAK